MGKFRAPRIGMLQGLEGLVGTGFDPTRDFVFGLLDNPENLVCVRPLLYVHNFRLPTVAPFDRPLAAHLILEHAKGAMLNAQLVARGCLFQVDAANEKMVKFGIAQGGVEEKGSRIFRIDW